MASIKQFIERRDNIASIISFIRNKGSATRMEISSALSLSWACVSDLTALLIADGLIEEIRRSDGASSEAKGRQPSYLYLSEQKYFLGIDINDSGMAITALGLNGKKIRSKKWNAEKITCLGELSDSVISKIEEMLNCDGECLGIGVAMEGIRGEDGSWGYPIVKGIIPFRPEVVIEDRFKIPVFVRHDPECMLYAAADDIYPDCMVLRVDSGIGAAAMKNGRMLDFPLELGWIMVGERMLRHILLKCAKDGNYTEFAKELGIAASNVAMILGINKVFIVGTIIEWFDSVREVFESSFKNPLAKPEFEVCMISDASEGAARVAMAEYPPLPDSVT